MTKIPRVPHCDKSECPVSHALDIFGDSWSILIVRDMLIFNIHEYKDFIQSPEGISTNILASRLKKLTEAGIIKWIEHPDYKTRKLYYLTPAGKNFIHVIISLVEWAIQNLGSDPMPPEMAKEFGSTPEEIIEIAFAKLAKWEAEYL